jgi:hypothetical protein
VLGLRWSEVDLSRRTARLADTKTGASLRPLSEAACAVISALPRNGDVVFASRSGQLIVGYRKMWLRIAKQSKRIAVELRCSPGTVRLWSARGKWRPYTSPSRSRKLDGLSDWLRERFRLRNGNTDGIRQELAREKNIIVSLRTVEREVAPLWREFFLAVRARQAAYEWMRAVLQKDINLDVLRSEVGDIPDIETLLQHIYVGVCLTATDP